MNKMIFQLYAIKNVSFQNLLQQLLLFHQHLQLEQGVQEMRLIMEMGGATIHSTLQSVSLILEIVAVITSKLIIVSTAYALKQNFQQPKVQL